MAPFAHRPPLSASPLYIISRFWLSLVIVHHVTTHIAPGTDARTSFLTTEPRPFERLHLIRYHQHNHQNVP